MTPTVAEVCPRCGVETATTYYGPCAACRVQLRRLQPPACDPLFKTTEKADGSEYTAWVGPLDLSGLTSGAVAE